MKFIESKLFGTTAAPENFSNILDLITKHALDRFNVYMWRGQANIDWPIHSAAFRRVQMGQSTRVTERHMRFYEKRLLKRARHQGYGYEDGRKLSDFEVLAKLQHHGAATRLIDFSRNLLVALWFACKSEPDKTGLLFGLHSENLLGHEGEVEERDYEEIFKEGNYEEDIHPRTWQPPVVTKRIASQGAQFLYSTVCDHPYGSLAFDKEEDAFIAMAITPTVKKAMLELLEGTFDVRQITLFPDIDGFCFANSEKFEQYSTERW
ncbi:hypothetical protein AI2799V1_1431 [Enterobacter cloacae]|uniref:FRG domain-containing protein n=1 Tax=Enterobacter cloacae complex TaxID=354276 RepID=UPI0012ABDBDA|nr:MULTISPECIES: FRG domain-containing protein [Enterobacter cloacae complex]MCK7418873.1 FRG domain-containing protein [Enterobacter asburiae]CAE7799091.1 hypothetical protein AI2799V1_1431 [Enterobacter cloacae]CAH3657194.1 hypothetical protein AI2799V1_1431 [Enterobacter cloacae]HAV2026796.1 FRG domain-containing protein [Enterobacter cloacae]